MRIVSLTIENFRSITSARQIPFNNYTLFVGPNNEGKSNILRALNIAMTTLQKFRPRIIYGRDGKAFSMNPDNRNIFIASGFNHTRDYPIQNRKNKNTAKCSNITIEFKLEDSEILEFKSEIKSNLNGTLPIKISFKENDFEINISKPGKGQLSLNKKMIKIANFVSQRIKFEYVPAVRTAGSADEVVRSLVSNELASIENNEKYIEALQVIDEIQRPILEKLSVSITETVSSFLPSVKNVSLRASQTSRSSVLRRAIQIDVNDGVTTELGQKGDGVQSLVALAIMRHASEDQSSGQNSIIAIEEPESHLHPKAIRDLRDVIFNLSQKNQVVISSHSPLLVKWEGNTSTIIVGDNKASKAKNINEVRNCLGVLVSDNLSSVEFSLIVEGLSDRKIIEKILLEKGSDNIKSMIASKRFWIRSIGGAGKLTYNISTSEQNILGYHVFFDSDQSAIAEISKALKAKVLKESDYTICNCAGMTESEIEDIIHPNVYQSKILKKYGLDITDNSFSGKEK